MNEEYKERLKKENEQAKVQRIKRKKIIEDRASVSKKVLETYSNTRKTGNIEWFPKHGSVIERWVGKFNGKKTFVIEKRLNKYRLKISDKVIADNVGNAVRDDAEFGLLAEKAEVIMKGHLKSKKK